MKHNDILEKQLKKLYILAKISSIFGDIPVSSMIISNKSNKIISFGLNNRQFNHKIIGHGEINAIINAEKKIKDWRLNDYTIFSMLKPCEMCAKVIETSRIKNVIYLIDQPNVENNPNLNYKQVYFPGNKFVEKYSQLFTSFFKKIR